MQAHHVQQIRGITTFPCLAPQEVREVESKLLGDTHAHIVAVFIQADVSVSSEEHARENKGSEHPLQMLENSPNQ